MERINELLDKYFRAETNLDEERELKNYFLSGDVQNEHKDYIPLFAAFAEEKEKVSTTRILFPSTKQLRSRRITLFTLGGISAVAASLIIGFMFLFPKEDTNYAIIRGKRIDKKEFVQKYAEQKLEKVNRLLTHNLEPMKDLGKVESGRKALKKLEEVQAIIDKTKENK